MLTPLYHFTCRLAIFRMCQYYYTTLQTHPKKNKYLTESIVTSHIKSQNNVSWLAAIIVLTSEAWCLLRAQLQQFYLIVSNFYLKAWIHIFTPSPGSAVIYRALKRQKVRTELFWNSFSWHYIFSDRPSSQRYGREIIFRTRCNAADLMKHNNVSRGGPRVLRRTDSVVASRPPLQDSIKSRANRAKHSRAAIFNLVRAPRPLSTSLSPGVCYKIAPMTLSWHHGGGPGVVIANP